MVRTPDIVATVNERIEEVNMAGHTAPEEIS